MSKVFLYILSVGALLTQACVSFSDIPITSSSVNKQGYISLERALVAQRLAALNVVALFTSVALVVVLYHYERQLIALSAMSALSFLLLGLAGYRLYLLHRFDRYNNDNQFNGWVMIFSALMGMITAFAAWSIYCGKEKGEEKEKDR